MPGSYRRFHRDNQPSEALKPSCPWYHQRRMRQDICRFGEDGYWRLHWDKYPVTKGHALLTPSRHVETLEHSSHNGEPLPRFPLPDSETLRAAMECIRRELGEPSLHFNIGFNLGWKAGQTKGHFHIHIIPRRVGDVDRTMPREGGVRNMMGLPGTKSWIAWMQDTDESCSNDPADMQHHVQFEDGPQDIGDITMSYEETPNFGSFDSSQGEDPDADVPVYYHPGTWEVGRICHKWDLGGMDTIAVKYLARYRSGDPDKGGKLDDLHKARNSIDRLIQFVEEDEDG